MRFARPPFLWCAREAEEPAKFHCSIFPDSRVNDVTSLPSESPRGPPSSVKVVEYTWRRHMIDEERWTTSRTR
ncbi:MAG TPA: VOC family protein [Casimicrobiaceae bacterium]|nr:VOC family protein [Casimicrobiaceae bacterium]